MALEQELRSGLQALGLDVPADAQWKLLQYVELLSRWNRAYNLTAVRDPAQMIPRHILDSLAAAPHVRGEYVLDVGTGAGLPGIPLALVYPERQFVLLDSNGKKTRFVLQAIVELGLANAAVAHARAESYDAPAPFDTVVSRAFSSVAEFVQMSGRLCAPDGTLLAMKGVYPVAELEQLPAGYEVEQVLPVTVPGLDAERHLVIIRRSATSAAQSRA